MKPSRLSICGTPWRFKEVEQPISHDGELCDGLCDDDTKTVLIKKSLPPPYKLETILHEYSHAVGYEAGLEDQNIPIWTEHAIIVPPSKDMVRNANFIRSIFEDFERESKRQKSRTRTKRNNSKKRPKTSGRRS